MSKDKEHEKPKRGRAENESTRVSRRFGKSKSIIGWPWRLNLPFAKPAGEEGSRVSLLFSQATPKLRLFGIFRSGGGCICILTPWDSYSRGWAKVFGLTWNPRTDNEFLALFLLNFREQSKDLFPQEFLLFTFQQNRVFQYLIAILWN